MWLFWQQSKFFLPFRKSFCNLPLYQKQVPYGETYRGLNCKCLKSSNSHFHPYKTVTAIYWDIWLDWLGMDWFKVVWWSLLKFKCQYVYSTFSNYSHIFNKSGNAYYSVGLFLVLLVCLFHSSSNEIKPLAFIKSAIFPTLKLTSFCNIVWY